MKPRTTTPLLSTLAYERILQAVFKSRVPMGGKVSQSDLVVLTGVPVGPVRDALKVLEADGLLKINPRSGIEMIKPTTELVRDTFQFRGMIEKPAARRFAVSAALDDLVDLRASHQRAAAGLSELPSSEDVFDRLSEIEDEFHPVMVSALENELVDTSYRRLQLMTRVIQVRRPVYPLGARVTIAEHLEVIEACIQRDADAAEAAISRHLTNALNRNLGLL
jgi:DNA-binding GntR family transcriptional regulator